MSQSNLTIISKPRTDDRLVWDVVLGLYGYSAVLLAHKLKLFPLLADKPRTLEEVEEALLIARRPAEGLLSVCASLGFVQLQDGRYFLTPIAEDYFLDSGPTYFGGELDLIIANASVYSLESLEKAVRTDTPQSMARETSLRRTKSRPSWRALSPGGCIASVWGRPWRGRTL